ncbi:MAG: hypothetical protein H6581_11080 [Bacteroidia bacterium]|nr:hypothetical protein [Bacteroidia bacterium]
MLFLLGPLQAQSDLPLYSAQTVSLKSLPASSPLSKLHPQFTGAAFSEEFSPELAGDGNAATAFLASTTQPGPAVEITYNLEGVATSFFAVNSIWIVSGKSSGNASLGQYSRPRTIRLWINGQPHGRFTLADSDQPQMIQTEELLLLANQSTHFAFEILDVFAGEKPEVAIAEIFLDGTGR